MNSALLTHPLLRVCENFHPAFERPTEPAPGKPAPPSPQPDEPGEPPREYPFWTCFIRNPRPNS